MRPIDADALKGRHCEGCKEDVRKMCETDPVCASMQWVEEEPTIDAVKVVRCKDCRHCDIVDETQRYFCRRPLGTIGYVPVQPDDYCSYGQDRR